MLRFDGKQQNSVKQLSVNKKEITFKKIHKKRLTEINGLLKMQT